ncbi:HlyU family transcriptional regulator [Halomonas sp. NO4]|uniref:HlyU family transcriptional regulator n=1 Tax=Halomonas sp. NO4 TaxID=2484813 RepID=UPI0013D7CA27|nr:HlyU family transcriptional regulator [Halomonas sp. NO4]
MLKKLLGGLFGGGGDAESSSAAAAEPVEYQGYLIVSEPVEQGGQYRVSGWIRKPGTDGEMREHRFERSDLVPGRDACDELMVRKAQVYIDQVGEEMFTPR